MGLVSDSVSAILGPVGRWWGGRVSPWQQVCNFLFPLQNTGFRLSFQRIVGGKREPTARVVFHTKEGEKKTRGRGEGNKRKVWLLGYLVATHNILIFIFLSGNISNDLPGAAKTVSYCPLYQKVNDSVLHQFTSWEELVWVRR